MSSAAERRRVDILTRGLAPPRAVSAIRAYLERTEDVVILGRAPQDRMTLRGVPARRIDVLVDQRADDPPAGYVWVVERARKSGRYDEVERDRIVLRLMCGRDPACGEPIEVSIAVEPATADRPPAYVFRVGDWTGRYVQLRTELDPDGAGRILSWHWTRWYPHLQAADVAPLIATWRPPPGSTLAEANRAASRELYQISRDLGWRKLTLRERVRIGFDVDSAQWRREKEIAAARERLGHPSGVGEYTLEAARPADERVMRADDPRTWED